MRRIPIPDNTSPYEFGVETDKTLADGSKALGIVRVTDQQSPFKPDDVIILVDAWQVTTDGRPVQRQSLTGLPQKVGIRQMAVVVPRGEYTHGVVDRQIDIAAAALALEAGEIPEPVSLPAPVPDVASAPNPAQPLNI